MEDEEARQELMRQTAVAVLLGLVTAKVPALAPTVVSVTPFASYIASAIGRIGRSREDKAAETLEYAVDASGERPEEFIDHATADDRRIELLTRTLVIAQDTALRQKRRALGRALAAGVTGDDAQIDDELLFIRAVSDLDAPHIKMLDKMADGPPLQPNFPLGYWDTRTIPAQMPEFGDSWPALLSALELHGLTSPFQSSTPYQGSRTAYVVTRLGHSMLARLANEADSDPDEPG